MFGSPLHGELTVVVSPLMMFTDDGPSKFPVREVTLEIFTNWDGYIEANKIGSYEDPGWVMQIYLN